MTEFDWATAPWRDNDTRARRKGWAPGNYMQRCYLCNHMYVGAKRCTSCAVCAYADYKPFRLIIAGSRDINFVNAFHELSLSIGDNWVDISEVVSGTAEGGDKVGEQFALIHGIEVTKFPADWDKHGKAAGPIRNRQMAEYADAAIVLWDGISKGSKNMITEMNRVHKPCAVILVDKKEPSF